MRKSCCIEDANFTPKNSSCSMVLRSACSHGHHSHKTLDVKNSQNQEVNCLDKKFQWQSTTEKASNLESCENYFHSSLKEFAYKSAKTYSILKESIYNHLDYSSILKNKSTNEKETSFESFNDLHSLQKSSDLSLINNSINQVECCHTNNNYLSSNYSSDMSRSREFSRSSLAAVNALSDSENEESLSKGTAKKRLSRKSFSSKSQSSTGKTESLTSNNHSNHNSLSISVSVNNAGHATYETTLQKSYATDSNSNYQTPTSSILYRSSINHFQGSDVSSATSSPSSPAVIDISNAQHTLIDRFRWLLWCSIYMKIIKCVNFDVWLLSRYLFPFRSFNKKVLAVLLLIPFLIYLLSGIDSKVFSVSDEFISKTYDFSSYMYSIISSPFTKQKSTVIEFSSGESSTSVYNVLTTIAVAPWYFLISLYSNFKSVLNNNSSEDLKLIALEIRRLKDDVTKMKDSHFKTVPTVKDDSAEKILVSDITSLRLEFQSLSESVKKLEKEVSHKSEGTSKHTGSIEDPNAHIIHINTKMKSLEDQLSALKKCCDEKWTLSDFTSSFEKHFLQALKTMVERDKDKTSPYYFFNEWLQAQMSDDKRILSQLKLELEKMKATSAEYDAEIVQNLVAKHVESLRKEFISLNKAESLSDEAFSLNVVQKLIREAILLYDADKTGKVDYALESGGGSILSTRCSESYAEKDGTISVLGLPLWSTHSSPRTAIQPEMQPGKCWAFKGSQGFLVIQLSYTIQVTGFTMEHIPLSLSPSGSIDSAPKGFQVWGLVSEKDNEGKLLGDYIFDQYEDSLQYFPVQTTYSEAFSFVELKILSNWGNMEYTCLYRFRVHGKQPKL